MKLVTKYGKMWPRNDHSLRALAEHGKPGGVCGVYVPYDGSMPVDVGKGEILRRLNGHRKSKTRGNFWDYFSWIEVQNPDLRHDVEALLLKILPYYLPLLNKQQASFKHIRGTKLGEAKAPDVVIKPKSVKIVRRSKKPKKRT
jgi:hypothetical protein